MTITPEDVRSALARRGFSQKWLAKKLHIGEDVVSRILHPNRNQHLLDRAIALIEKQP